MIVSPKKAQALYQNGINFGKSDAYPTKQAGAFTPAFGFPIIFWYLYASSAAKEGSFL